ncbi:MAG: hypothetical protein ACKVT2_03935 [Saprospiraceae bacterium]
MKENMRKYKPLISKSQAWDSIENQFSEWGEKHFKMLELVQHIKNSTLSNRIFGSTSMDKLVVSIYDPIEYEKESLHVIFDLHSNKWHFKYFAMPFQSPEFVRIYDSEKGIEKFDNFINMIKW